MGEPLPGKKTYLIALGIILVAVGGFLSGDLTVLQSVTQVLIGLGIGAVRIAIK